MPRLALALLATVLVGAACDQPSDEGPPPPAPIVLPAVAAGYYATCGLAADSTAYCWGSGRDGQLGGVPTEECSFFPGEAPCASAPVPVTTTERFIGLTAGGMHFCALTASGTAFCWGSDRFGQLGVLDTTDRCRSDSAPCARTPRGVVLGPPILDISAGDSHTCAVLATSSYCWGYGAYGRLGTGSTADQDLPAVISGVQLRAIAAGASFTCGLATADSTAYCWGYNHLGQLGDGGFTWRATPAPVSGSRRFVAITAGTAHACAITPTGDAYCWGGHVTSPALVPGGRVFSTIEAGQSFTCGTGPAGSFCWGQIPDSNAGPTQPAPFGTAGLAGGDPFVRFAAGSVHGCGITGAGLVYCWGWDYHGLLGDGPADGTGTTPVLVVAPDSSATEA